MPTIGTHDGSFHCDEALACFLLQQLPAFAGSNVTRTRNPAVLDQCDIVVDVGGVYDPAKHRYDHHQREFNGTMKSLAGKKWVTRLSSAGLVYLHFGREIIKVVLGQSLSDELVEVLFDKMYENFVEEIDAIDNGVNQFEGVPKYKITSTVSARVGRLGPSWNDPKPDYDGQFQKGMALVGAEFLQNLNELYHVWLPARTVVQEALENRFSIDASGEIIQLDNACPWKAHLFDLEEEMNARNPKVAVNIKYALFTDQSGKWRVMCVPEQQTSFKNRLDLPEPWRGVRDNALSELSGIPGCIFVHAGGFIGGNETREGALEMARRALTFPRPATA